MLQVDLTLQPFCRICNTPKNTRNFLRKENVLPKNLHQKDNGKNHYRCVMGKIFRISKNAPFPTNQQKMAKHLHSLNLAPPSLPAHRGTLKGIDLRQLESSHMSASHQRGEHTHPAGWPMVRERVGAWWVWLAG